MNEMLDYMTGSPSLKQFWVSDTEVLVGFPAPSRIFFEVSAPDVSPKTTPPSPMSLPPPHIVLDYSAALSSAGMAMIAATRVWKVPPICSFILLLARVDLHWLFQNFLQHGSHWHLLLWLLEAQLLLLICFVFLSHFPSFLLSSILHLWKNGQFWTWN